MNQSGPTRHGDRGRPTPTPRPGTRPLYVDIEALHELVEVLMTCYRYTNQWHLLPQVLDRLEPNIQNLRWRHKIILCRALQAVGLEWGNREAARRELERLPSIEKIKDVDILTFTSISVATNSRGNNPPI